MALTQAQRDALKELSKQSGPGKSSLPGLYFFGPSFGSFLPSGNYASTSARGALSNLQKLGSVGIQAIYAIANHLTGLPYGENFGSAYADVLNALEATKGVGVDTIPQGTWDRGKKNVDPAKIKSYFHPATGQNGPATMPSIVFQNGSSTPTGIDQMSAALQSNAYTTLDNYLTAWDLPGLVDKAWQLISEPGNFKSASAVLHELRQTDEYKARFPGLADRAAKGLPRMSEQQYMDYELKAKQYARQYGLPHGFMNNAEIGKLIASDVSADELAYRIKDGYEAAMKAPKDVRDNLKRFYGLHRGDIAAYMLSPQTTFDVLQRRLTGAKIAADSTRSGFGQIGKKTANELARQVADGSSSMAEIKAGFSKIAPLTPLENAQLGQQGQATATKQQLLGQAFTGLNQAKGTTAAGNQQAVQLAEQARTAGLQGGGGYAQNSKGGLGIGSASTEGTGR